MMDLASLQMYYGKNGSASNSFVLPSFTRLFQSMLPELLARSPAYRSLPQYQTHPIEEVAAELLRTYTPNFVRKTMHETWPCTMQSTCKTAQDSEFT